MGGGIGGVQGYQTPKAVWLEAASHKVRGSFLWSTYRSFIVLETVEELRSVAVTGMRRVCFVQSA